ncbi:MAG: CvpA family protein [Vulcanimicrobiota bacterium]
MIDLYIILFFLLTMLIASLRGVVSELFDLLTFSLGFMFALSVFEIPGQALFRELHGNPQLAFIISFLLIFIPVGLFFASIGLRLSRYVKEKIPARLFYGLGIPISIIKSLIIVISVLLLLWSSSIKSPLKDELCKSSIANQISLYNPVILSAAQAATPPGVAFKVKCAIEQQEMHKKERSMDTLRNMSIVLGQFPG